MISVIVPVYNVEKYLPDCIESVLGQTYSDLELLLVDDGSTDNSGKLCDSYAEKDSRVRVFHKENGGVSSARNCGMENASGQYIFFVDADDYLERPLLSECVNSIDDEDVIFFNYQEKNNNNETYKICQDAIKELTLSPIDLMKFYDLRGGSLEIIPTLTKQ